MIKYEQARYSLIDLKDYFLTIDQTTPQTTVGTFTFPNVVVAPSADSIALKVKANSIQTTNIFDIFANDGTTLLFGFDINSNLLINRYGIGQNETYPGLSLANPTPATSGIQQQNSPSLILSGNAWVSGASKQHQFGIALLPQTYDDLIIKFKYKRGSASWGDFFVIQGNGDITSTNTVANYATNEAIVTKFSMNNSADATNAVDQYTPVFRFVSRGWKSAATAASQSMALGYLNAPEQGVISPIGVHKIIFSTDSGTLIEANELLRFRWGSDAGILGSYFNYRGLSGYRFSVVGLPIYANNAAAITGGLAAGDFYRTGADPDPVCVVH